MIANLLPGGHANLDCGHPSLLEDHSKGVLIVEVHPTSFRPKEVKDEAPEDVKGLLDVRKSPGVVALESKGVVLALVDGFLQQDERPNFVNHLGDEGVSEAELMNECADGRVWKGFLMFRYPLLAE